MDAKLIRYEIEEKFLSPYAFKSKDTKGRSRPQEPTEYRTEFMRDRDRIIHCKSFRRLKHKTQVFISRGRPLPHQAHSHIGSHANSPKHLKGVKA